MSLTMILTNHNRLGTDWHLAASIRSVCSMNFNNLFHHFPGCGELPEYGVSDDDYGPLPPPSPSLTPEIKALVGELLVSIKERVIGYPFRKFEDEIIDPERLYLDDVLENLHSDMYDNMDDVSKALSTVIDDGWRGGTISVKARRGEVATFSPKEMSFFVKTIRKTYSKVHDKIVEDAAIETSPDTNNNDDAIIINSGLEDTSEARLSAAQPPVLNMQEISRDILGLGGDQQRPSSQIIRIGGENYLLPQEPLPIPDVQEANTILNMPIIVHDETEARDYTGCLTPSVSRTPQNLVEAASAPPDYITVNVDSTDTTVSFSYAFLDTGPRKRKGSPMEASVSPKKVAREPVSPCSKESRGGRVEPLDSEPATQKIVTNNYDMPILSESPQLSTSLSPELEPMDTSDPAESLPHKFVSEETDSTTNNVISIPDTDDMANIEIISKGQLLLDSMEFPERKCRKVAMEQRRQRQIRDQQSLSNLPLFPDAWTEENNRALKTSRKRAFGEDLGWSGGGGAAVPPLLELQGVPHPPQRRQLLQLPHPHRQVEIPLDIHHKMQDPRREDTQQLPEILYLYE